LSLALIQVAANGRYFSTHNGEPFLFIGCNDAITWQGLEGLFHRRDVEAAERHIADLAAHGITVLRIMLEYVDHEWRYFEHPAGHFVPSMVQLWDDLFALCEKYGLRIMLTPWDTHWMARRWKHHPYNAANGGPAKTRRSLLTDEATIAATIARFEFIIRRWGGTGVLAAWDLFNEVHPRWGGTPGEQAATLTRISHAIREIEHRIWGNTTLQTVSIFGPDPGEQYHHLIFSHPDLDFATTHIYRGAIDNPFDTVTPALTMAEWVRFAWHQVPAGRPFMDTEHAPIHYFNNRHRILPEAFDDEYERHLIWAHFASGGAGSGMRWPSRHPHLLTPGMRRSLHSLSQFAAHIHWPEFRPTLVNDLHINVPDLHGFAIADCEQAVIWLLHTRLAKLRRKPLLPPIPLHGVSLELHSMRPPTTYRLMLWDTIRGMIMDTFEVQTTHDGILRFSLSMPTNDLAILVQASSIQSE